MAAMPISSSVSATSRLTTTPTRSTSATEPTMEQKTGNGDGYTDTRLGSILLGDNGNADEGCVNINNVFNVRPKCLRSIARR